MLILVTLSNVGLEELWLEIYQNSNNGNCHQIEWNIKTIAQNLQEGTNNSADTKLSEERMEKVEDSPSKFFYAVYVLFVFWITQVFRWFMFGLIHQGWLNIWHPSGLFTAL